MFLMGNGVLAKRLESEGEKDTDERRESSGRAPRLGAPLKYLEALGPIKFNQVSSYMYFGGCRTVVCT